MGAASRDWAAAAVGERIGPQEFVGLGRALLLVLCRGRAGKAIAPSDGELISNRSDEQSVVDGDDK